MGRGSLRGRVRIAGVALAVGSAGCAAAAQAPPQPSFQERPRLTIAEPMRIETQGPSEVAIVDATLPPGTEFPWHTHPGPEIALITAGTVVYTAADQPGCAPQQFSGGQGHVIPAGVPHMARNTGSEPLTLQGVFIVPPGASWRSMAQKPPQCP